MQSSSFLVADELHLAKKLSGELSLTSSKGTVYNGSTKRTQYSPVHASNIAAEAAIASRCALRQRGHTGKTQRFSRACRAGGKVLVATNDRGCTAAAQTNRRWRTERAICAYDYVGRRATTQVTANGNVTLKQRYIYRGYLQIRLLRPDRANKPCLWLITWDPPQPIATRPPAIRKEGTWYAYGWNLTKNICEVFGPTGYIRTAYTYTPYGEVSESGDATQPIQWSGEYHDPELGLVYFNYRYYNPYSARWISRDPLAETAGLNLYKYTTSPYKAVDVLGSSLVDIAKSVAPHIEGSISGSFTTVFPIAPPAVTVNTTMSNSGSGCKCCDKATQKNKLLIDIAVSGEGSLGLETSVDGKKYRSKGRGSKWRDSQTGRFSKKPGGRSQDAGIGTELYGTGDGCCPEETFSGSISVGARASAGVGYGVIIDVNETFALGAEPEFSITASTGFVVGARAEAYVSVSGTISFTVDFSS